MKLNPFNWFRIQKDYQLEESDDENMADKDMLSIPADDSLDTETNNESVMATSETFRDDSKANNFEGKTGTVEKNLDEIEAFAHKEMLQNVDANLLEASMMPPPCAETTLMAFLAYLDRIIDSASAPGRPHSTDSSYEQVDGKNDLEGSADSCLEQQRVHKEEASPSTNLESFISQLESQLSSEKHLADGSVSLTWRALQETVASASMNGEACQGNGDTLKSVRNAVVRILHMIRPIDLDKLYELLQTNRSAGEIIQGKEVLVFIGCTGKFKFI